MTAHDETRTPPSLRVPAPTVVEGAPRDQAGHSDNPTRTESGGALEVAFEERDRLIAMGADTLAVDKKILELKRTAREGGRLRSDDFLDGGRYRLVRALGTGGFATVWEAFDRQERVSVAVKVLHSQFAADSSRRERFFRGARKMNELRHPAIVPVRQAYGEDGGWYFFVMDLLPDGDLRHGIASGALTREEGVRAVLHATGGVHFAHENGMIHRDISPANIMLAERQGGIVTDFDLVHAFDTTGGTRTGAMGKLLYSAPELLTRPQDATVRSDVFSLGMTAAFCLHGAEIPGVALYRGLGAFVDELRCNEHVKHVLRRATALDPGERFESALAFRNALETALATPVQPPPRSDRNGPGGTVLVVDDEKFIRDILADFLHMEGHEVFVAESIVAAREVVSARAIDVAIVDLKMPGGDGLELLTEWEGRRSSPTSIVISGFGTVEAAVEAMKRGAIEFLLKPFKVEEVLAAVRYAMNVRQNRAFPS